MSSFSLEDIKRAADKQFGDTEITLGEDTAVFLNPMRLPKDLRKKVSSLFREDQINKRIADGEEELDVYDLYRETLQAAARSERDFKLIDEAFGDVPALWTTAFNLYNGTAELGEASTSES